MAYKFNLGTFNLKGTLDTSAGDIELPADSVDQADLVDNAVGADELAANAVVEDSIVDNAVTLAKMAGVARGSIIHGDSSGDPAYLAKGAANTFLQSDGTDVAYVALSGDATLNAGAITIADNAVTLAKMAGLTRGSIIIGDASGDPSALAKGAANTFLQSDGTDTAYVALSGDATLSAGAITIANDAINADKIADNVVNSEHIALGALDSEHYSTGSVESVHLKGAIANAKLANSALAGVALGGSAADLAAAIDGEAMALTAVSDLDAASAGNMTIFDTLLAGNGNTLTIGAHSDSVVVIKGDLQVDGDTVTLNTSELLVEDKIIQVAKAANSVATSKDSGLLFGQSNVNGARFLYEIDAGNGNNQELVARQGTGDDAASLISIKAKEFYGDGANLTNISADAASAMKHSMTNITASNTISAPGMVIGNIGLSSVLTISGSFSQGDQILVKGNGNLSTSVTLTVTGAAGYGYNFDGQQSVLLESPRAGFTLIYDGDAPNALWHIM